MLDNWFEVRLLLLLCRPVITAQITTQVSFMTCFLGLFMCLNIQSHSCVPTPTYDLSTMLTLAYYFTGRHGIDRLVISSSLTGGHRYVIDIFIEVYVVE